MCLAGPDQLLVDGTQHIIHASSIPTRSRCSMVPRESRCCDERTSPSILLVSSRLLSLSENTSCWFPIDPIGWDCDGWNSLLIHQPDIGTNHLDENVDARCNTDIVTQGTSFATNFETDPCREANDMSSKLASPAAWMVRTSRRQPITRFGAAYMERNRVADRKWNGRRLVREGKRRTALELSERKRHPFGSIHLACGWSPCMGSRAPFAWTRRLCVLRISQIERKR